MTYRQALEARLERYKTEGIHVHRKVLKLLFSYASALDGANERLREKGK